MPTNHQLFFYYGICCNCILYIYIYIYNTIITKITKLMSKGAW
ncbi:MAG: hypothetical protein N7Q72_03930 [Spiroplasma sp. Tabriz.8]|nr:hypothetical protein [Spiroplasma sp. Tabriz.8]